jgi:hypothetical protein
MNQLTNKKGGNTFTHLVVVSRTNIVLVVLAVWCSSLRLRSVQVFDVRCSLFVVWCLVLLCPTAGGFVVLSAFRVSGFNPLLFAFCVLLFVFCSLRLALSAMHFEF